MLKNLANPNGSSKLFGFNIPNMLFYGILAVIAFIFFQVFHLIGNTFKKIAGFFGIGDEDEVKDGSISNQKEVAKQLSKNQAVQSQMTVGNRQKAEELYNLIHGLGVNIDSIIKVFNTITGPNQMAAVSQSFGIRTVIVGFLWHTGDLKSCLRWRLFKSDYKRIEGHLNLLNQIK